MPSRFIRSGRRADLAVAVPVLAAIVAALVITIVLLVGERQTAAQLSAVRSYQSQGLLSRDGEYTQQLQVACANWAAAAADQRAIVPPVLRAAADMICAETTTTAPSTPPTPRPTKGGGG